MSGFFVSDLHTQEILRYTQTDMSVILDLLFPKKCVGCKKTGTYFCTECISNITQTDLVCPKCEKAAVGGQTHPICKRRYGLDGLWSLGIYQNPLRLAIQKLKYKGIEELSETMVNILIEYFVRYQPFLLDEIKKSKGGGWAVVPVPLYWWRENKRGFNQSGLVGKLLAEKLGLQYMEAIKKVKHTKSQVKLKGYDRQRNIRNAFSINPNYLPAGRQGQLHATNYILIDDVWTTGSTLRECCYVLKRSGAKKVWALTLAR